MGKVVTFICKRSGNTVSFTNENDIAGLRNHEGYTELKEQNETTPTEKAPETIKTPSKEVLKNRGRPRKVH
jgi:hypothetical protein